MRNEILWFYDDDEDDNDKTKDNNNKVDQYKYYLTMITATKIPATKTTTTKTTNTTTTFVSVWLFTHFEKLSCLQYAAFLLWRLYFV